MIAVTAETTPSAAAYGMGEAILVREWAPDQFHRRVLELERQGYLTRLETYSITPEVHPETGEVIHLYSIELVLPSPD